jgi:hypothetical protein
VPVPSGTVGLFPFKKTTLAKRKGKRRGRRGKDVCLFPQGQAPLCFFPFKKNYHSPEATNKKANSSYLILSPANV